MSDVDRPPAWAPPDPAPLPPPAATPAGSSPASAGSGGDAPRKRRRWILPVVVVVAALAVAATIAGVIAVTRGESSSGLCPGADGRTRELRRCLAESLAYVETPVATGSGVLLEDGYVVTNAHVIDPYGAVDVSFDGGRRFDDVAVVGIDAFADIALLGPIETDRRPLALDPVPDFDDVDEPDVYLVGYPGGPSPAIRRSRSRPGSCPACARTTRSISRICRPTRRSPAASPAGRSSTGTAPCSASRG